LQLPSGLLRYKSMSFSDRFIQQLQDRLAQPLPGREAQYRMAHVGRQHAPAPPPNAKQAGVLALFYPNDNQDISIVLIERVSHNSRDRHRGQIGLPGGRYEEEDENLGQTALRETEEEVGVTATDIQLLGRLTELYIPVSNFLVHPYIGYLDYTPRFVPEASEVKSVLQVPFHHFHHPATAGHTDIAISATITLQQVPYFRVSNKIVWGATAMMLSELLDVARPLALQD